MAQQELLKKAELLAQQSSAGQPARSRVEFSPEQLSKLKKECDDAAERLKDLQIQLTQRKPKPVGNENPTKKVLGERLKMLIGYEEAYRESKPLVLPEDTDIQQIILMEDLEKNVREMNDTLAWVKAKRKNLKQSIESESELVQEREDIKRRLEQRMEEVENEGTPQRPNKSILADVKKKEAKVTKYSHKLMNYLRRFSTEHFPPPEPEDIVVWQRKRRISITDDILPLLDILETVMNRSVEVPNDPYVLVNDSYWPPYLQLLVRVGIVQRHPEDDNRIKMTPFHL